MASLPLLPLCSLFQCQQHMTCQQNLSQIPLLLCSKPLSDFPSHCRKSPTEHSPSFICLHILPPVSLTPLTVLPFLLSSNVSSYPRDLQACWVSIWNFLPLMSHMLIPAPSDLHSHAPRPPSSASPCLATQFKVQHHHHTLTSFIPFPTQFSPNLY